MGEPIKTEHGFVASPFTRLARTHGLMVAGDTAVAVALAGSLFFDITPDAARWRIALYLLLTVAPFAVVAPMVGPALDRMKGGRRMVLLGSAIGRAVVCAIMIRDVDTLLLFPEAFLLLVFSKSYAVSKAALVPTVVHNDDELLEANAKLTLIGAIVGFIVMVPALPMLKLGGPEWVLGFASIVFVARDGARVADEEDDDRRGAGGPTGEGRAAQRRHRARRLGDGGRARHRRLPHVRRRVLHPQRRVVEFWFAVVLAASGLGALLGAFLTPRLRKAWREENILISVLLLVMVTGIAAATSGSRLAAATAAALVVGLGASGGEARVRLDRAARRARREPRPVVREVRDPLPARVGGRCVHPGHRPDPDAGRAARPLVGRPAPRARATTRACATSARERQGARAPAQAGRRDGRGRSRLGPRKAASKARGRRCGRCAAPVPPPSELPPPDPTSP